jgi:2,3-bisphosphoglycerate-independent phosphoglycerate mutase
MPAERPINGDHPKPVVLCVLDGWGAREDTADNAVATAKAPNWRRFMADCPNALIQASALDVGLPAGQMGNSEVGHMNLGAGRVVMQDMPRIDAGLKDGSLAALPQLTDFIARLKASGGTCHIMGLISPGGVHSHQDQIAGIAGIIGAAGVPVAIHAFLDGRDTPPKSALEFLTRFEADIAGTPGPGIVSVTGRYYAMDRDKRWDRVSRAYDVLTRGAGETAADANAAVKAGYDAELSDEFILPTRIGDYGGMEDGDGVLMGNFRADRAREILSALVEPDFDGFERPRTVSFAAALGVTEYSTALNAQLTALYPLESLSNAHVTFFFNGGVEEPFPGEERILIPSPKVATYDLQPEMSAPELTDRLVAAIESGTFDFILVNYANGDMVGHTGNLDAAITAVETVDECLGRLAQAVTAAGGSLIITADHGNAEQMYDAETGQAHTAHTTNQVPLILINGPDGINRIHAGKLADLAPTVLDLMGLAQPKDMTGHSLLSTARHDGEKEKARASA